MSESRAAQEQLESLRSKGAVKLVAPNRAEPPVITPWLRLHTEKKCVHSQSVTEGNAGDPVSCGDPLLGVAGTNMGFLQYRLSGRFLGGSGGSATVTQLQVTVNYRSLFVSSQTRLLAISALTDRQFQSNRNGPSKSEVNGCIARDAQAPPADFRKQNEHMRPLRPSYFGDAAGVAGLLSPAAGPPIV